MKEVVVVRMLYLQVEDGVPGVQVDAHGLLLDGHDGEAHIDAAVELPLLQLREGGEDLGGRGGHCE